MTSFYLSLIELNWILLEEKWPHNCAQWLHGILLLGSTISIEVSVAISQMCQMLPPYLQGLTNLLWTKEPAECFIFQGFMFCQSKKNSWATSEWCKSDKQAWWTSLWKNKKSCNVPIIPTHNKVSFLPPPPFVPCDGRVTVIWCSSSSAKQGWGLISLPDGCFPFFFTSSLKLPPSTPTL